MSKDKTVNAAKPTQPRDAQVIQAMLKEMGVDEFEPRVVNQLLDFSYGYVTDVLEEAKVFSNHAQRKQVTVEDVRLAVQSRVESTVTAPPPRELLLELARARNSQPLPAVKSYGGLRLPPDRYCLTTQNYKLKPDAHTIPDPPTPIRAPSRIVQSVVTGGRASQGLGARSSAVVAGTNSTVMSHPARPVHQPIHSTVQPAASQPASAPTVNMGLMNPALTGASVTVPSSALKRKLEPDNDEYD